ncbi:ethionine resistance protein [Coemansia sp. BCRC 34301]|nr:ethionine resistance protein [Coemansia sp. BCRC 34301]
MMTRPNLLLPAHDPCEATPLLPAPGITETGGILASSGSAITLYSEYMEHDSVPTRSMARQEATLLVRTSIPLALTSLLQFSFHFANILSLGHLGANELAAAALANMTLFMLVHAPAVGLASALDTFCATAFTASPDKTLVGFHLQRGLIAVTVHFLMVLPILLNVEVVLVALNQDAVIAHLCSAFVRAQLIGSLPWMYFECVKRFLQAQGHMKASTHVLLVVLPIHLTNSYLLVWSPTIGVGFLGAAFANYYRLAIPSMIMVCSDWAAWELMAIAASYLGNVTLAGQSIVINTCSLTYQIPGGLSIAVSNRTGNLLGQSRARRANISANIGLALGSLSGALSSGFCLIVSAWWGKLYSSDPEVISTVALIMPICALFQLADAINGVSGGVLRSLGRQSTGAWINFPSYYLVGFPLGLYLTYGAPGFGVAGLWIGLCAAVVLTAVGQTTICLAANYTMEVDRCIAQVNNSRDIAADSTTSSETV